MKNRNLVFVIIMSIITFGIYDLYWLIDTRAELTRKGQKIPSIWTVVLSFLAILLFAIFLLNLDARNSPVGSTSVLILLVLLGLLSLASVWVWINWLIKYCRAAEKVTRGDLGFGFNMALAILLSIFGAWLLWPVIDQYFFNKVRELEVPSAVPPHNNISHA